MLPIANGVSRQLKQVQMENAAENEFSEEKKFEAKYDIGRANTEPLVELRYQLRAPRQVESDGTWHRIRYAGGINHELIKTNTRCFLSLD